MASVRLSKSSRPLLMCVLSSVCPLPVRNPLRCTPCPEQADRCAPSQKLLKECPENKRAHVPPGDHFVLQVEDRYSWRLGDDLSWTMEGSTGRGCDPGRMSPLWPPRCPCVRRVRPAAGSLRRSGLHCVIPHSASSRYRCPSPLLWSLREYRLDGPLDTRTPGIGSGTTAQCYVPHVFSIAAVCSAA